MSSNAENGKLVEIDGKPTVVSTCHNTQPGFSLADGVQLGTCRECGANVVRVNPDTGVEEFLDGASVWTTRTDLRPVNRQQ